MKCLLKLSSSLVFHFLTHKTLPNNCDVFLSCVPSRSSWEAVCPLSRNSPFKPLNTWAGCHPFWLRQRGHGQPTVWWDFQTAGGFLDVESVLLSLGSEKHLCVSQIPSKNPPQGESNYGAYDWVMFMINKIDWGSSQRSKSEMKDSISYYQPPKPSVPTLETHRIQLFWLNCHIHGKLQAVYWKISPLNPAIFVLQLCLCSQHFSFLAKAQCFLGRTKDRLYLHTMLFSGWTRLQLDSVALDSTADLWYQAFSITYNIGSRSEPCQTKAVQKIWLLLEASDKG